MAKIRSLKFNNFYSFGNETELSMLMNKHVPDTDLVMPAADGQRLTKIMAVIGPNASGKTNLIKPLKFLNYFMSSSFRLKPDELIPIETHFFSDNEQADFELEFEIDQTIWKYKLSLTEKRVIHESLWKKTSRLFSYVFDRNWDADAEIYQYRQNNFGFPSKEFAKVRANASLISTAIQFNVALAIELDEKFNIFSNVNGWGREHIDIAEATNFYAKIPEALEAVSSILGAWDLGLSEIRIKKEEWINPETAQKEERNLPMVVHTCGEKSVERYLVWESSGTMGAYAQLATFIQAMSIGGVAVIDELEADLHPLMLETLIELYSSPTTNPQYAQLIFTCHTIEVLNLLNKAQVTLVQKNDECISESWRLDSVKGVRNDDNLYAKYMSGAYGAVPDLG